MLASLYMGSCRRELLSPLTTLQTVPHGACWRERDDFQEDTQRRVHQADDESRKQGGSKTCDIKTPDNVRDDHQAQRAQQPIDDNSH